MLLYETRLQEQSARGSCPVCRSSLSPDSGIINKTALQAVYTPQTDKENKQKVKQASLD